MDTNKKRIASAINLFEKNPIWKSLLYIITLSILVGFLQGIYIFISQILMVQLIPLNSNFTNFAIYGTNNVNILINSESIIRTVNNITAPFISIAGAISLGFGLGTSINYSQALGSGKYEKAKEIYSSGFYTTVIFGILSSIVIVFIANFVLPTQIGSIDSNPSLGLTSENILIYQETVIRFARNFIFMFVGANMLQCLVQLLSTCLNSEGKNLFVTIILVSSTIINLIFVFILLKFTQLGVLGSSTASISSWVTSIFFLYLYIWWLNYKNSTLLLFSSLKVVRIQKWIFLLILGIGATSFLRNISSSVLAIINNNEIIKVTGAIGEFEDENFFNNINGAIIPIYNLILSGIVGIVRGGRTAISYLYSAGKFREVKKVFNITTITTIIVAIFFYVFSVFIVGDELLLIFGITPNDPLIFENALISLKINTLSIITFSLGVSGTLFFQSIGDIKRSNALAIFQGIIVGIPLIYANSALSIAIGGFSGTYLFYSSQVIIFFISGLIILGYSYLFLKNKLPNDIILKLNGV